MGYAMVATASIAAVASVLNTVLSFLLRRFMQPPSGGTLGEVAERAEHAANVTAAGVNAISRELVAERRRRGETPPEGVESLP